MSCCGVGRPWGQALGAATSRLVCMSARRYLQLAISGTLDWHRYSSGVYYRALPAHQLLWRSAPAFAARTHWPLYKVRLLWLCTWAILRETRRFLVINVTVEADSYGLSGTTTAGRTLAGTAETKYLSVLSVDNPSDTDYLVSLWPARKAMTQKRLVKLYRR